MPVEVLPPDIKVVELRLWLTENNYLPPPDPPRIEAKIRVQLLHRFGGITQFKIAQLIGVSPPTVGKWISTSAYYPAYESCKKILSLISEDGELLSPL